MQRSLFMAASTDCDLKDPRLVVIARQIGFRNNNSLLQMLNARRITTSNSRKRPPFELVSIGDGDVDLPNTQSFRDFITINTQGSHADVHKFWGKPEAT